MPDSNRTPANRKSRDDLNALAERLAGVGHWRWDLKGEDDYWSPGAFLIHGLPVDSPQPTIEEAADFLHPEDRERVMMTQDRAIETGSDFTVRARIHRPDGELRHIEIIGFPETDQTGNTIALFGAIKDITERLNVEESLRRSDQRLRDFISASSDLVWEIDENGVFTRLEGENFRPQITLSDFIGKTHRAIPGMVDGEATWRKFDAIRAKQQPFRGFLFTVKRPDGSPVHIDLSAVPRFDADGVFRGYRGTSQNVTDRVEFERSLRESEARFHDFARASSDAFWEVDAEGRFTRIDGPAFRSGVDFQDYIGRRRQDVPGIVNDETTWQRYEELLTRRKPFRDFRFSLKNDDGAVLHIQLNAIPFFSDNGDFLGFHGTSQNITERVRNERRLHLLERAVEETQDGILITGNADSDYAIQYVNSAFETITGYPADEVIGRNCRFLHRHERDQAGLDDMRRALAEQKPVRVELRNYRKDDAPFYQELSVSPVHNSEGAVTHFVGVQHDVTDRVLTEERLKEAQKLEALGRMTGGLAHDFNNILSIIRLNLELAQDNSESSSTLDRNIERALNAVGRASKTTASLLAFARRQPLSPKLVNVAALLDNLRDPLALTLGKQIHLSFDLDSTAFVMVDPQQLENAVINIALNARDAMAEGGRLTIESRDLTLKARKASHPGVPPGDHVVIRVTDTGTGISQEILDQVFEPFFTTKQGERGSGLGLSMVHGFVRQSGGYVHMTSEEGTGTAVTLYLPAAEGRGDKDEQGKTVPTEIYRGKDKSVLLIEDEQEVRSATAAMLSGLGFRVIEAASRKEAMEVLDRIDRPDLVITDIVLAESADGLDLAKELRSHWSTLPILLVSGYSERMERGEFELDQYSAFLQKPFGKHDLSQALYSLIEN